MANVNGSFLASGVDLVPGQEQTWILFGGSAQDYGRVFSFTAWPLSGPPWEIIFEVTKVTFETDAQGGRRIFVTVRNSSDPATSEYGSYGLFGAWTDVL
jgi:hypothetical protein